MLKINAGKKKKKGRRRVVEVKFSKPVLVAPVGMHNHPLCLYCCVQGEHDTFLRDVAASYPLPACVSTGKDLVGHRKEVPSQAYPKPVEGQALDVQCCGVHLSSSVDEGGAFVSLLGILSSHFSYYFWVLLGAEFASVA